MLRCGHYLGRVGRFIVFEGGEAVGKSTQAALLADRLGALLTREPGGTAVGEALRRLLLDLPLAPVPKVEALLMLAARSQHVAEVIDPALARGEDVVCDRYSGSTLAYQGFGRGLALDELQKMNIWATGGRAPDVIVLLDLPVADARQRLSSSRLDRIEAEGEEFLDRAQAGFRTAGGGRPAQMARRRCCRQRRRSGRTGLESRGRGPKRTPGPGRQAEPRGLAGEEELTPTDPKVTDEKGLPKSGLAKSGLAKSGLAKSGLAGLVGQDVAANTLRAAVARPVHAYLFVGPPGAGKLTAAMAFAAMLLCPRGGDDGCDTCRRVLEGLHPDVFVLEREGAALSIEQAREVSRISARSSLEGGRSVVILPDLHLARDAVPALLKTIEEPPGSTVFIGLAEFVPPSSKR